MGVAHGTDGHLITETVEEEVSRDEEEFMSSREHLAYMTIIPCSIYC